MRGLDARLPGMGELGELVEQVCCCAQDYGEGRGLVGGDCGRQGVDVMGFVIGGPDKADAAVLQHSLNYYYSICMHYITNITLYLPILNHISSNRRITIPANQTYT